MKRVYLACGIELKALRGREESTSATNGTIRIATRDIDIQITSVPSISKLSKVGVLAI